MIGASRSLRELTSALCGRALPGTDWKSTVELANHALLTPALFEALAGFGQLALLGVEMREYLAFIHECNRQRNLRLSEQLRVAVAELNRHGIVPLLLKGAVPLFHARSDDVPSRMTSDLDVAVDPVKLPVARACLEGLGYICSADGREMVHAQHVGVLELRAYQTGSLNRSECVRQSAIQVRVPSTEARAMHWILHDLVKEGDYWRGRIDLRHLHDLAQLAQTNGLEWRIIRDGMPDQSARNAFDTQLRALHHLFGTAVPEEFIRRPLIRLHHWRRVFTSSHPLIGAPLRLAGNLAWGARKLSRSGDRILRDPFDLLHRGIRLMMDRDHRSKV